MKGGSSAEWATVSWLSVRAPRTPFACALAIQESMQFPSIETPPERQIQFRTGDHDRPWSARQGHIRGCGKSRVSAGKLGRAGRDQCQPSGAQSGSGTALDHPSGISASMKSQIWRGRFACSGSQGISMMEAPRRQSRGRTAAKLARPAKLCCRSNTLAAIWSWISLGMLAGTTPGGELHLHSRQVNAHIPAQFFFTVAKIGRAVSHPTRHRGKRCELSAPLEPKRRMSRSEIITLAGRGAGYRSRRPGGSMRHVSLQRRKSKEAELLTASSVASTPSPYQISTTAAAETKPPLAAQEADSGSAPSPATAAVDTVSADGNLARTSVETALLAGPTDGTLPRTEDNPVQLGDGAKQASAQLASISPKETLPSAVPIPASPMRETTTPAKATRPEVPAEPRVPAGDTAALPPVIDTAALVERGDALLGIGDVVSARLFYERAVEAGDAHAAIRLGETFDPAFLAHARSNGVRGDPAVALKWYKRARDLGASEADILVMSIEQK